MPLLDVRNLTKDFGGLRANDTISFALDKDELLGVIGPNGAGKTTLFNCIAGLHPVTAGHIIFDGEDITRLPAYEVARQGLAYSSFVATQRQTNRGEFALLETGDRALGAAERAFIGADRIINEDVADIAELYSGLDDFDRLGGSIFRIVHVAPGTLLPDIGEFKEKSIQPYFPNSVLEKRGMGSRCTGSDHDPIESFFQCQIGNFLGGVIRA